MCLLAQLTIVNEQINTLMIFITVSGSTFSQVF